MDRREFMQGVGSLGAGGTLPIFDARDGHGYRSSHLKVAVVAMGGILGEVFRYPHPKLPLKARTIAINTCYGRPSLHNADQRIVLGEGVDQPARPEMAARLARAQLSYIQSAVTGFQVVFLVAGLGGAAGTGISPVVAEILHKRGTLTLAYVIKPFNWEGERRRATANAGIEALRPIVDALMVTSNDHFAALADAGAMLEAVLQQAPKDFWTHCRRALDRAVSRAGIQDWCETRRELQALWA